MSKRTSKKREKKKKKERERETEQQLGRRKEENKQKYCRSVLLFGASVALLQRDAISPRYLSRAHSRALARVEADVRKFPHRVASTAPHGQGNRCTGVTIKKKGQKDGRTRNEIASLAQTLQEAARGCKRLQRDSKKKKKKRRSCRYCSKSLVVRWKKACRCACMPGRYRGCAVGSRLCACSYFEEVEEGGHERRSNMTDLTPECGVSRPVYLQCPAVICCGALEDERAGQHAPDELWTDKLVVSFCWARTAGKRDKSLLHARLPRPLCAGMGCRWAWRVFVTRAAFLLLGPDGDGIRRLRSGVDEKKAGWARVVGMAGQGGVEQRRTARAEVESDWVVGKRNSNQDNGAAESTRSTSTW